MLEYVFYIMLFVFLTVFILRAIFTLKHSKKQRENTNDVANLKEYTIVQPIMSGDNNLSSFLELNLKNAPEMNFIWILDKGDIEAEKIANKILEKYDNNIKVIYSDKVKQGRNPKVYKLRQAIEFIKTKYTIMLDDDCVIDFRFFNEMKKYEKNSKDYIATGVPRYRVCGTTFSKLVSAFVNQNSQFTYLPLAYLGVNNAINGMFYAIKTETLRKYNIMENIEEFVHDEYTIVKFLEDKDVEIIQTAVPCEVSTDVKGFMHYIELMKRWMVFTNIYAKENMSFYLFTFLMLPAILPLVIFIVSLLLGTKYVLIFSAMFFIKLLITYFVRKKIFDIKINGTQIFYELFADLVQPFHYINSLIFPNTIVWRGKKIKVVNNKVIYKEI